MLQLCVSQNISNSTPYFFKATGIRVYSLEEALYHAYHYWRESVDELAQDNLASWVASQGISQVTSKVKSLSSITPLSKRLLAFLSIIEYFSKPELTALKTDLERWEHRLEWEKLKDRADHLVSRGEPAKALPLYHRALSYDENAILLNNMAIANMQLSNHQEAVKLFAKSQILLSKNTTQEDSNSFAIALHYAEALTLNGDYEDARNALQTASNRHRPDTAANSRLSSSETAHIQYINGLMAYQQKDYPLALDHFKKAVAQEPEVTHYTHKLAETYRQMHQYDKAITALEQSPGAPHHVKMAEIYAAYGHTHMPEAIRHIRQAISQGDQSDVVLWTKLAEYYRKDYDNERANDAISHALPSKNTSALLENARIKKSLGRMREYRAGLSDVLKGVKEQYSRFD